jgi:Mg/Co/Ni transporter MgtE
VLLEASENVWDDLIDEMSDRDMLDALQTLDIDEQIYLVQHLPRNLTGRLLASLPADERARVRQVMRYEKNSVGAIMEFGVITVRPDVTLRCSAICGVWAKCRRTPISCLSPPAIKPCSASWSCKPFCSTVRSGR